MNYFDKLLLLFSESTDDLANKGLDVCLQRVKADISELSLLVVGWAGKTEPHGDELNRCQMIAARHHLGKKAAKRIDYLLLNRDDDVTAQGNLMLNRLRTLQPVELYVVQTEEWPAALFEQLQRGVAEERVNPRFLSAVPELFLYDPGIPGIDVNPFVHKNPGAKLCWQDIEFSPDLLDKEETEQVRQAIVSIRPFLITGPIGTGKTLLARYIHYHCERTANGPFIDRNAGAITQSLFESELFGVAPGAATGTTPRTGLLKDAQGGTLFLDEIATMSKECQAKLLRVVTERMEEITFTPVGGKEDRTRVRFLLATNCREDELAEMVKPDMLSRVPSRIRLKSLYEKRPDALAFAARAADHFSRIDESLRRDPGSRPKWDADALTGLFKTQRLPSGLRDFRSFVSRVFENRRLSQKPPAKTIGRVEMEVALPPFRIPHSGVPETPHIVSFPQAIKAAERLLSEGNLVEMERLSEAEMMDLVYQVKKCALNAALAYSPASRARAMRVYGMSCAPSFKKHILNPNSLHPNKSLRCREVPGQTT